VLDEVFATFPDVLPEYVDRDPARKCIRARADNGRVVTLFFHPRIAAAGISSCRPDGDNGWFGEPGWSPVRRWVVLTSIHADESINATGRDRATEYIQVEGGFDPLPGDGVAPSAFVNLSA
jgi:hypothetical protein